MYLLLVSCILGMVEGLTEFLPISSTFHVMFVEELLGMTNDDKMKFLLNVVIQLGAILSIVRIYWKQFFILFIKVVHCSNVFRGGSSVCVCWNHIIFGILPTVILGCIFYENIKNLYKIEYMFYSLISGSVLLLIAEWFTVRFYREPLSDINNLSCLQAFFIGCFQCLALYPGFSRSGATIAGGLLVGVNRRVAAMFSFFLAVPLIFSATILVVYKNIFLFTWENFPVMVIGFFTSFVVSLFTVKIFMRIIQRVSFVPFVVYRLFLASLVYFFSLENHTKF